MGDYFNVDLTGMSGFGVVLVIWLFGYVMGSLVKLVMSLKDADRHEF